MHIDRPTPGNSDPGRAAHGARNLRIALVVSRYHEAITSALRDGAIATFLAAGGEPEDLLTVESPGAFELVAISAAFAGRKDIDAIVALGCVITGETPHDQYICNAVAQGLAGLSAKTGVPAAFGVLTCRTLEQAQARAGGSRGNKGEEAMAAAIEAASIIRAINAPKERV